MCSFWILPALRPRCLTWIYLSRRFISDDCITFLWTCAISGRFNLFLTFFLGWWLAAFFTILTSIDIRAYNYITVLNGIPLHFSTPPHYHHSIHYTFQLLAQVFQIDFHQYLIGQSCCTDVTITTQTIDTVHGHPLRHIPYRVIPRLTHRGTHWYIPNHVLYDTVHTYNPNVPSRTNIPRYTLVHALYTHTILMSHPVLTYQGTHWYIPNHVLYDTIHIYNPNVPSRTNVLYYDNFYISNGVSFI